MLIVLLSNFINGVHHLHDGIQVTAVTNVVHPCVILSEHDLVVLLALQLLTKHEVQVYVQVHLSNCFLCLSLRAEVNAQQLHMRF